MTTAMHDNPSIYPTLPPRAEPIDPALWWVCVESSIEGDPWRTCWEYVLTHQLSPTEGAAFWTAANLVHHALMAEPRDTSEGESRG